MSKSQPSEMSRDQLERRVQELEQRVEELEEEKVATPSGVDIYFGNLAEAMGADVEDYTADAMQHVQAIQEQFETLQNVVRDQQKVINDLEDAKTRSADEAWLNVVQMARNQYSGGRKVKLDISDINKATGYSERHCGNKIEEWGEDKPGASWDPYRPPSEARQGSAQKKKLVLDMEEWAE